MLARWWDFIRANPKEALSIAAAILTAAVSLFVGLGNFQRSDGLGEKERQQLADRTVFLRDEYARLTAKFEQIAGQVKAIDERIKSLSSLPKEDALNMEIQGIKTSTAELTAKQAKIESVILENPLKALEMPLLRRDLEGVKQLQASAYDAVKKDVDRAYDINKWLLGTMAVSIVTLALSNLLKPRDVAKKD
jgi:hypothetical protein